MTPRFPSYFDLFRDCASRRAEAVALTQAERRWTYAELLANATGQAEGIRRLPGPRVALACDVSLEMVAALLGTWAAGKSFTHLDPAYPAEYNRALLREAGISCVIADRVHAAAAATWCDRVHPLGAAAPIDVGDDPARVPAPDPENPAYVIFTSGSTGKPKGVIIPHRALVNFCQVASRTLGVGPQDVQLLSAPTTYALSVRQLFVPLAVGACVDLAPRGEMSDPARFIAWLHARPVTLVDVVPSHWRTCLEWLEHQPPATLPSLAPGALRQIVSVGETLRGDIPARWRRLFGDSARLVNIYGQTETTGIVAHHEIPSGTEPDAVCPIGRPAEETRLLLLDAQMRPVADGETGEIYIDSPCLASGYLHDEGASRAKFPANPFPGGVSPRLYRTGDLGRRSAQGILVHLGRMDQQVKIRGMRVEPGEIEHRLEKLAGVERACVLLHEEPGEPARLLAFLVPAPGRTIASPAALRTELQRTLPAQMIPAGFHVVAAIPTTAHGKVDRASLLKTRRTELPDLPAMVHQESWEPVTLTAGPPDPTTPWLVFSDQTERAAAIAAALAAAGRTAIVAPPFAARGDRTGSPTFADQVARALAGLHANGATGCKVLFAPEPRRAGTDGHAGETPGGWCATGRSVVVELRKRRIDLRGWVLAAAGLASVEPVGALDAEAGACRGFGRTLQLERPGCRFLTLDVGTAPVAAWAGKILEVAEAGPVPGEDDYALRGPTLVVRRFVRARLSAPPAERFRDGGTYLFTGGTGVLALALCRHLAQRIRARFILLSRTGISSWSDDQVVEDPRAADAIRAIRAGGSTVELVQVDVGDAEILPLVLAPLVRRGLTGIVHAAAARGRFSPISDGADPTADEIWAAKAAGAGNLVALAAAARAEFVMLFSSLSSLLGRIGFADYCAANAFLDGIAGSGAFSCPVVTVNWDNWRGTGLRNLGDGEHGETGADDRHALTMEEGLRLFDLLAAGPAGRYAVSREPLPDRFAAGAARSTACTGRAITAGPQDDGTLRQIIRASWAAALRTEEFTDECSLFAIGGDSLMAVQLCLEAERSTDRRIPVTAFLQKPTVSRLVELASADSGEDSVLAHGIANATGSKAPLLLWGVDLAMPLVRLLGPDQPVIAPAALPADEIARDSLPLESVVQREIAPYLPFLAGKTCHVAGYSRGGIIAYEAARQLRQLGFTVPAVLLIDTSASLVSDYQRRVPGRVRRGQALRLSWHRYRTQTWRRTRDLWRLAPWRWPAYFTAWAIDRQVARIRARRGGSRPLDAHGFAVATYRLPPSDIDLVLFKATENSVPLYAEADYGWHRVTSGCVTLRPIGGAHFAFRPVSTRFAPKKGILEPPHVDALAAAMLACLHPSARCDNPDRR